jgi:imidazolonepropionase-like amidohydrolase
MWKVFPKAFKSGMKYTFGSDARHGNFIFELEIGVKMGLSPMEAICACTKRAADTLGILDKTGPWSRESGRISLPSVRILLRISQGSGMWNL